MEQSLPQSQADIQRAPAGGFKITDEQRQELIDKMIAMKMAPQAPDSNMQRLQQLVGARETASLAPDQERVNDSVNTKFAAGYIDDLTGSKISSRMTPEKMPLARLQEAIQNRRSMPKESTGGLNEKDLIELARREKGEDRRQDYITDTFKNKGYADINKRTSKLYNSFVEHEEMVGKLKQNIAEGTVARTGAIVNGIARFVNGEKGPLAEGDVRRSMPASAQQYWSNVRQFFKNNKDAINEPLPEWLTKDLHKQVALADAEFKDAYQQKVHAERNKDHKAATKLGIPNFKALGAEGIDSIYSEIAYDPTWKPYSEREKKASSLPSANPKLQAAQSWLQANPDHPKADAVRKTIEKMKGN